MTGARVVLAGAHGHGRVHLENIRRLATAGLVELAGVCDPIPLDALALDGLGAPDHAADLATLLDRTAADVVLIVTPIPTHTDLTLTAVEHGADVLLEKPPAATYADFDRMLAAVEAARKRCQVGFQSLGSAAIPAVRQLIADGLIGEVRGIGAAGAWERTSDYFRRAAWSGRRRSNGVDVVDGALTNPFAHALATALSIDGSEGPDDIRGVELELYHAFPIESDDTSCVRLRTARGTVITVAVSLCAPKRNEPYVIVHGEHGRITFYYTQDEVRLERAGQVTTLHYPRTDLLTDLLAKRDTADELLVPLHRTAGFMRVLEAVRTAPDPKPIPEQALQIDEAHRVIPGIEGLVAASAERLALYSELGAPWAGAA
jgi:predicted dehydrogenase